MNKIKKALLIIAFNDFRDEEYVDPRKELERAGIDVAVASTKLGTATGKFGMKVVVDLSISAVKVPDYNAILFIGGSGANCYYNDPNAHKIAQEAVKEGKLLGAICGAPPILSYAGVLKGKKATMFSDTGALAEGGATYTGNGVEIDGNIITATGPDTAKAWGKAIADKLNGK